MSAGTIAATSLALNFILVCCAIIAARVTWVHFRARAVLDWLAQFNTRDFLEADDMVCSLVDGKDPETLVERINEKAEYRIAVTLALSFVLQAATAAKMGLMHRETLERYAVHIVPYYWESLKPWIDYRRRHNSAPMYHDIEWLANEIARKRKKLFPKMDRDFMSSQRQTRDRSESARSLEA